jgi:polyhydroxyalkanoate synthase
MPGTSAQTKARKAGQTDPESAARATAPHRLAAPRPLPFHLAAATAVWTGSLAALPNWKNGSIPWPENLGPENPGPANPELPDLKARAEALGAELAAAPAEAFAEALTRELRGRADRFLTGLERYRSHPYRRWISAPARRPGADARSWSCHPW